MYVNKCIKCGREFETKNPKRVICPDCLYPEKAIESSDSKPTEDKPLENYSTPGTEEVPRYYSAGGGNEENRPPRPYNQQGGGYNRDNRSGGYNRPQQGGYNQQGGGYNRPQQGGYNRPQQGGYNQQGGGYNRPQQGGYNQQGGGYNRPQQGGYNQQGGGYNRPQQGGYNRPQQGGYNQQGGGYNRPQQGGYNRPQQGGYNQQGGGYNRPQQGGFNRGGPRPGGFQQGRPGGFQQRRPMGAPKQLLVSREQVDQIELLYKLMLPLPNPDAHEVIGEKISLEPRKVFFGINLVRQKLMLPKLPFPKRKLAISPDQLFAIKNLYEPLLPLPPIGCHKIIASQLKMDEWRVHVGIGLIRGQMGLERWNQDRPDAPEEYKKTVKKEAKAEAKPKKAKAKKDEPVAEEKPKRGRKPKTEE